MGIKLLKKEKDEPRYLVAWKTGYIQFWEDWSQFLRPKRYNWLNFRPIWFEIDYDKLAGENFEIEFGLMGFNLRFQQFIRENNRGKELKREIKEIKTSEEFHNEEVKRLKNEIVKLKKKLSRLSTN